MQIPQNVFSRLLLGKHSRELSYSDYRLAMLTGFLSVVSFFVSAGYLLFDLYNEIEHTWRVLSAAAVLALVSIVLNRVGRFFPAKLTLGLSTNLCVFFFASIEPVETSLSFLFVLCAMGAISTLGVQQARLALVFILLPVVLFFLSVVIDLHLFTRRSFDPEYVRVNMIVNFLFLLTAAVLNIYFLLTLYHRSEKALRENEIRLHEKNEELKKANKELDRFVYSASHDLRSPVSSVRGLINLIRLSPLAPETKSYVEMMDKKLVSMNTFIEDITLYSRNTRVRIKAEPVNLKALVEESLMNIQYYPGADRFHVDVDVAEDITLVSDPTRLRVVLANLLSNAFKYSNPAAENPFVSVKARAAAQIEISIRDNGIGIAREFLPKIFDMFFQANDKAEGSGLGLYIVRETLEKIHGDIHCESELGKGTEFIVRLPKDIREHQKI